MKRILKPTYVLVQYVMLLVSIPKVAHLFLAYDSSAGSSPVIAGYPLSDVVSYAAGVAIDCAAAVTSWAALTKYEAGRRGRDLIPPALILLLCTSISIIANYEDAALASPGRYAQISVFGVPAALVNPIALSFVPLIVLFFVVLTPAITAEVRIESAEEIEARAAREEAKINARARIEAAQARANATVRQVQVQGLAGTAKALRDSFKRGGSSSPTEDTEPTPPNGPGGGLPLHAVAHGRARDAYADAETMQLPALMASADRRALRNQSLRMESEPGVRRIRETGMVSATDLVAILRGQTGTPISDTTAREILKAVPSSAPVGDHRNARIEAPIADVIAQLASTQTLAAQHYARLLKSALRGRGRARRTVDPSVSDARITMPTARGIASAGGRGSLHVLHPQEGEDGDAHYGADEGAQVALS